MVEDESRQPPYALLLALLLSALLHSLLMLQLRPLLTADSRPRPPAKSLSFELESFSYRRESDEQQIAEPAPAQSSAAAAAPDENEPDAPAQSAPTVPSSALQPRESERSTPRRLNLSLPSMDTQAPLDDAVTGTVFSPQLATRIAEQRRSRASRGSAAGAAIALGTDSSSYAGGQWETLLRVGDLCFRVIEANPLETLSNEQWFQVDCD